jgi:hypothetical protein
VCGSGLFLPLSAAVHVIEEGLGIGRIADPCTIAVEASCMRLKRPGI